MMEETPNKSWILDHSDKIFKEKLTELTFPIDSNDQFYINRMTKYVDASYDELATKYHIAPAIGIAGTHVGFKKAVVYLHFKWENKECKYLLANPKIISQSLTNCYLTSGEGSISVKDKVEGFVKRKYKIIVRANDLLDENKVKEITATGLVSVVLQHEMDHINAIMFYDRINSFNKFHTEADWIKI